MRNQNKLVVTLRKTYQNAGFFSLSNPYSGIRTELYAKIRVRENPSSDIYYAVSRNRDNLNDFKPIE